MDPVVFQVINSDRQMNFKNFQKTFMRWSGKIENIFSEKYSRQLKERFDHIFIKISFKIEAIQLTNKNLTLIWAE